MSGFREWLLGLCAVFVQGKRHRRLPRIPESRAPIHPKYGRQEYSLRPGLDGIDLWRLLLEPSGAGASQCAFWKHSALLGLTLAQHSQELGWLHWREGLVSFWRVSNHEILVQRQKPSDASTPDNVKRAAQNAHFYRGILGTGNRVFLGSRRYSKRFPKAVPF